MLSVAVGLINGLYVSSEIGIKQRANRQKCHFLTIVLRRLFSAGEEKIANCANSAESLTSEKREIKKSVKVAFIGYPNVGKSTLINALTGLKICAASKKPHTTRKTQKAFILRGDTEMILLDTPGIVSNRDKNRFSLSNSFNLSGSKELKTADLIGLIFDTSNSYHTKINTELRNFMLTLPCHADFILIFNKIDIIKDKRKLLTLTHRLLDQKLVVSSDDSQADKKKFYQKFSRVFMISALNNDGIEDIAEYIYSLSNVSHKNVTSERITDHKDEELIAERVRAALLENLAHEIPYNSSCEVEYMCENAQGELNAVVLIKYTKKKYKNFIEGKGNRRIEIIKNECEKDLSELFGKPVFLKLITILTKRPKNIE